MKVIIYYELYAKRCIEVLENQASKQIKKQRTLHDYRNSTRVKELALNTAVVWNSTLPGEIHKGSGKN